MHKTIDVCSLYLWPSRYDPKIKWSEFNERSLQIIFSIDFFTILLESSDFSTLTCVFIPQAPALTLCPRCQSPQKWTRPISPGCQALMADMPRSSLSGWSHAVCCVWRLLRGHKKLWLFCFGCDFTSRVKQASRGKHEWASLPVPTSKNYLLVTGLLAGTGYQFSVLPQNKLGSGPFSEIVSVRTQGLWQHCCVAWSFTRLCLFIFYLFSLCSVSLSAVPTEPPTAITALPVLGPPVLLEVNQTERGFLLQWSPPEAPPSPLTGFILQARQDQGQWVTLTSDIGASQRELLVERLLRVMMVLFLFCFIILSWSRSCYQIFPSLPSLVVTLITTEAITFW